MPLWLALHPHWLQPVPPTVRARALLTSVGVLCVYECGCGWRCLAPLSLAVAWRTALVAPPVQLACVWPNTISQLMRTMHEVAAPDTRQSPGNALTVAAAVVPS